VSLRARILLATPWARRIPQTIVFTGLRSDHYLGTCEIWTPSTGELRSGRIVRLTGLVVASGIFVSGAGTERRRVAMICETRRALVGGKASRPGGPPAGHAG